MRDNYFQDKIQIHTYIHIQVPTSKNRYTKIHTTQKSLKAKAQVFLWKIKLNQMHDSMKIYVLQCITETYDTCNKYLDI